jgi:hypothetical protein
MCGTPWVVRWIVAVRGSGGVVVAQAASSRAASGAARPAVARAADLLVISVVSFLGGWSGLSGPLATQALAFGTRPIR